MGFLLAASLALLNSNALYPGEDHGAVRRVIHYGRQVRGLEGAVLASRNENTLEVREMLGPLDFNSWIGGLGGIWCEYPSSGVSIWNSTLGPKKRRITWTLRTYSITGKGRIIVELVNPH